MRGRMIAGCLASLFVLIVAATPVHSQPSIAGRVLSPAAQSPTPELFSFYAIYDRLADTDGLRAFITLSALSADGMRLAFAGQEAAKRTPVLFTVKADGSELTQIALPNLDGRSITGLAISQDGAKVFFSAAAPYKTAQLYRVEGGSAARILDAADPNPDLNSIQQVQCTADGRQVFFLETGGYNGDVWRVRDDGGGLSRVVDDVKVVHSRAQGGPGYNVAEFSVSADGGTVAFILTGYFDKDNRMVRHTAPEVFVAGAGGGARQLTDQSPPVAKSQLRISGDGSTIVYMAQTKPWRWHVIAGGGSAKALDEAAANFGGAGLTFDGRLMFYVDSLADGGRLVDTRSGAHLDVFPAGNVADITLVANSSAMIDRNGDRVSFLFIYASYPTRQAVYIGHFMRPDAVAGAPVIEDVAFVPASMPPNDPKARVNLTARISEPDGLSDIARTSTGVLLAGVLERNTAKVPLYFGALKDDGRSPDRIAGDGAFTAQGKPGGLAGRVSRMTVRTGAMDRSNTVVLADVVFPPGSTVEPGPADLIR